VRSGVFPWNEHLGVEITKRTKYFKADTVLDLCAGSGYLGMTVARKTGARKVILLEIDPVSCQMAKILWMSDSQRTIYIIQGDVRKLDPAPFYDGLIVSNPPCAPLPGSFYTWRNIYGGRDGLLYVRAIIKWLLQCQNTVPFFVSTYFLSPMKEISYRDLSAVIGADDGIIKNIYHFQKPAWNWIGIDDKKNPGFSEEIFAWYFDYCKESEKETFQKYLRENPYAHHILIEGIVPR
jgi:hypothetical protein